MTVNPEGSLFHDHSSWNKQFVRGSPIQQEIEGVLLICITNDLISYIKSGELIEIQDSGSIGDRVMFYGKKLSKILIVLTLLFLVNSCAGLQINPPGPSTQALLIIPVEVDAKVVSVRHDFYYIYEITKADDNSFSYEVEIKFPLAGDMFIIDSLTPGDYYVRKFSFLPTGATDTTYGNNSFARNDQFSLESGKITIFSKSLKITLRNQDPGRFATITYNFDIVPVTSSQEKAILSTLKELPNFDKWEVLD